MFYVHVLHVQDMPCSFKPTIDMNLTFEETQVYAYVFNPNVDPRYVGSPFTHKNYISYGSFIFMGIILLDFHHYNCLFFCACLY